MTPSKEEWWSQAEYDFGTAQAMLASGRTVYAVFMCHLAVEKGLKALVVKKTLQFPPRTHNLLHLLKIAGKKPEPGLGAFIVELNETHTVTRYPEELKKLIATYSAPLTRKILDSTQEDLSWIKQAL